MQTSKPVNCTRKYIKKWVQKLNNRSWQVKVRITKEKVENYYCVRAVKVHANTFLAEKIRKRTDCNGKYGRRESIQDNKRRRIDAVAFLKQNINNRRG